MRSFNVSLLYCIAVLGFALRMWQAATTGHIVGVDGYYLARVAEDYRSVNFAQIFNYPPGTPFLIAAFSFLFLSTELSAILLSATFSSLAIIAIFFMVRSKFGEEAALYSSIFIAFSASMVSYGSLVKNLNFVLPFLIFGIFFVSRKKIIPAFLAGFILLFFAPFDSFLLSLIWTISILIEKKKNFKILLAPLALAVLAFTAGIFYGKSALQSLYFSKEIPQSLAATLFAVPEITEFLIFLSPILIVLGILGILQAVGMERDKKCIEIIIPLILFLVAFQFHLFETDRWYVYVTVFLSIFAGLGMTKILQYGTLKRIAHFKTMEIFLLVIIGLYLSVIGLGFNSWGIMDENRYSAYQWLRTNTPEDSVVLATIYESHWIYGIGYRNPVASANLIGENNFPQKCEDIILMYNTTNQSLRKELLEKYNVSYIFFSDKTLWQFGDVREEFHKIGSSVVYSNWPYEIHKYK